MKKAARLTYVWKLGKYIKGLWGSLALSFLFNILFKVTPIIISFVTSYMISMVVVGSIKNVWLMFSVVCVLIILSGFFAYMDLLVSHDTAYRILATLRNIAYDKIDELAPAAMESRHSGELTSIVLEDIEQLEWFYAHTIGQIITAIIVPTLALITLGMISPWIPVTIIPFIIVMVCIPFIRSKKSDEQGVSVKDAYSVLNTQIVDGVQGLKDIISFGWQGQYFNRFLKSMKVHQNAQMDYAKRGGNETRRFQLAMGAGSLCGQAVMIYLVATAKVSAVWLVPVFILCTAIFAPLQEALTMSTNYGLIFGSVKRLFDLLQMNPTVTDTGTLTYNDINEKNDQEDVISFEHVFFTYPEAQSEDKNQNILKDFSFTVKKNETVALVGASGSGKTTVARLLQRFWDVDSGDIKLNGINIKNISLEALRDFITVVPQESYLFNTSVTENLRMGKPEATNEEIIEAAKLAQADGFIRNLPNEYETVLGERGFRLSGGEKQRLCIAQAFIKDSPVLVLDEASANLDSKTENQINTAIDLLKKGRATLVIAHRLSTICQSDRIVLIKDGCVEATGKYEELLETSEYFKQLLGEEKYGEKE